MVTENHYRWDFIGLSTDDKPTPATSDQVTDGSTFYTSDDSKLYIWYKDQWYEKEDTGGGGGGGGSLDPNSYDLEIMNPAVEGYIDDVTYTFANANAYDADDYATSEVSDYVAEATEDGYRGDQPEGQSITLSVQGNYHIVDWAGRGLQEIKNKSGTFKQYNLTPEEMGIYTNIRNEEIRDTGLIYPTGQVRMIYTDTTYGTSFKSGNVRDIGGWECDGGTLRYGRIFRGARFNGGSVRCSATDQAMFKDLLNVKDEIDLRNDDEARNLVNGQYVTITESAFGDGVNYIHLPISNYSSGIVPDSDSATNYKAIFERIIDDLVNGHPVFIHCMAGADRTGTVCAIIEALCGVSRSDIDKDYELTSFTNFLTSGGTPTTEFERYRTAANWKGFIKYFFDHYTGASFRDRVLQWWLDIGLDYDDVNTLRSYLIDGNPTPLAPVTYTISSNLTHVTLGNTATSIGEGETYTSLVTADSGYTITSVSVTMGGVTVANAYDSSTGTITVSNVSGNIVITAAASSSATTYTVTYQLSHSTVSPKPSTVEAGTTFTTTVTPETGYQVNSVTTIMNAQIVSGTYDSSTGVITLSNVSGNIVIIVSTTVIPVADVNIITDSFTTHGTTYQAIGCSDNTRISTSTGNNTTSNASGWCTPGYIPILNNDVLTLQGVTIPEASSGDGKTVIALYDEDKAFIGALALRLSSSGGTNTISGYYSISKSTSSGTTKYLLTIKLGTYSTSSITLDTTGAKWCKFSAAGTAATASVFINSTNN